MKSIKPKLTPNLATQFHNNVAAHPGVIVNQFSDLQRMVAELSCLNKDYVLYFRGQGEDYKPQTKSAKKTALYPTLYRENNYEQQWDDLDKASRLLCEKCKSYPLLEKKPLLQWSILQHYGVTHTPLIDVTQSLRVACTFAQMGATGNSDYVYVYVVALPYVAHRIHVDSEEYLTVIRLLSIAPPNARRPHCQEGFLVGEDVILKGKPMNKRELNLNRRLVAKFRIPAKDLEFWDTEKKANGGDLLPTDDEMLTICKEIKEGVDAYRKEKASDSKSKTQSKPKSKASK